MLYFMFDKIASLSVLSKFWPIRLFFLFTTAATMLQAQDTSAPLPASPSMERDFDSKRTVIGWSEYRQKVRQVLPEYSLEQVKQELAELELAALYNEGDVLLKARSAYTIAGDPDNIPGPRPLTSHTFSLLPELSKKFLLTGTTVSVGLNQTLRSNNFDGSIANVSTLAPKLTVTQDLLQNFFGLLHRLKLADAEQKRTLAAQQRAYSERKLQQGYDQLYLNWLLLWRTHNVLVEQVKTSAASLRNAQRQRSQNYIDNGAYQQIYSSHLLYRQTLLGNEQQLMLLDQRLARFLGAALHKPDLEVMDALLAKASQRLAELSFEDSWDWAISQKNLEQLQLKHRFSKLSRLPSLTLSNSLTLKGSASYNEGETPNYSELKPEYGLALDLSWPVLQRKAKNSMAKIRLQLQQLQTKLNQQQQEFAIRIANQRASHEFALEDYQLQQQTAKAKAAVYASNQVKYRQARASVRDLLDAEIQTLSADLALLKTESQLVQQVLDFDYESREQDILAN